MRNVLFTDLQGQSIKVDITLPGIRLNPPRTVLFRKKLYKYIGSGLTCNFYREIEFYAVVKSIDIM